MEWINVDVFLPEDGQRVLAYGDWESDLNDADGDCFDWYTVEYNSGQWDADGCYYGTWLVNVTHWMPLPSPPKGRDK